MAVSKTEARIKKALGKTFLWLTGWKEAGAPPPQAHRFVLIAAPHTSNWDLVFTLALTWAAAVDVHWLGKHTLFGFPFGPFFRFLGGIPVQRERRSNLVDAAAALFAENEALILTVPAEGTRERVDHWKSGFYFIARKADVPVVLGYLDFKRKAGGFGPALSLTGDLKADMDRIRAFYADKAGRFPEKFATPRLKGEEGGGRAAEEP